MKFYTPLFLFLLAACSESEQVPATSLADVQLSLAVTADVINIPNTLATSNNSEAQATKSYIALAESMTGGFIQYLQKPTSPLMIDSVVTPLSAAAAAKDFRAYIWSVADDDQIGYQVSESGNKYVFEAFYQSAPKGSWNKFIYAEEEKNKNNGVMKVYSRYSTSPSVGELLYEISWTRDNDILKLDANDVYQNIERYSIEINEKTKAGILTAYIEGKKVYFTEWDADGNGNWTEYHYDPDRTENGSWSH